ncbi:MAG: hypothetical protein V4509_00165 [Patescibacteria group bacterium]
MSENEQDIEQIVEEPIEPVPVTLAEWHEIDRRTDLVGRGDKVHDLHRTKAKCFEWWCVLQEHPDSATVPGHLKYEWTGFIFELREAERQKREQAAKDEGLI